MCGSAVGGVDARPCSQMSLRRAPMGRVLHIAQLALALALTLTLRAGGDLARPCTVPRVPIPAIASLRCLRPSVRPSVRPPVRPSVRPSVSSSFPLWLSLCLCLSVFFPCMSHVVSGTGARQGAQRIGVPGRPPPPLTASHPWADRSVARAVSLDLGVPVGSRRLRRRRSQRRHWGVPRRIWARLCAA